MTPSGQIRAKFRQAHRHTAALQQHIADFLAREPFEVFDAEDQETGDLIYVVKIKEEPPDDLSLALGDAVHNARSALDHIAWHLVRANGHTPDRKTYFPIGKDPQHYRRVRSSLRGASAQVFDLVDNTIKPYRGGDDRFALLHDLDIEDKHHMIVPVGASHRSFNLHLSAKLPRSGKVVEAPVVQMAPADRQYPLSDGAVIFRVGAAARHPNDLVSMKFSFTFDLCFSPDSASAGEPIIPTIPDLIQGVETAVSPLIELLP